MKRGNMTDKQLAAKIDKLWALVEEFAKEIDHRKDLVSESAWEASLKLGDCAFFLEN